MTTLAAPARPRPDGRAASIPAKTITTSHFTQLLLVRQAPKSPAHATSDTSVASIPPIASVALALRPMGT